MISIGEIKHGIGRGHLLGKLSTFQVLNLKISTSSKVIFMKSVVFETNLANQAYALIICS